MFNWQRRASCAARKAKLVLGILPIKAKPAPALVHWWELAVISRLISPSRMAQTSLKLPSTRVRVKSAWIEFYALLDCGTPVDPELALGQIYGATLRAIGHSISEEIIYDAEGHPLTRDLRSYGAPKIGDIPRDFRAVLVPSDDKVGPFGRRSISEIGVNGAAFRRLLPQFTMHAASGYANGTSHRRKYLTALEKI